MPRRQQNTRNKQREPKALKVDASVPYFPEIYGHSLSAPRRFVAEDDRDKSDQKTRFMATQVGGLLGGAGGICRVAYLEAYEPFQLSRQATFPQVPNPDSENPVGFRKLSRVVGVKSADISRVEVKSDANPSIEQRGGATVVVFPVTVPGFDVTPLQGVFVGSNEVIANEIPGTKSLRVFAGLKAVILRGDIKQGSNRKPADAVLGLLVGDPAFGPAAVEDMFRNPTANVYSGLSEPGYVRWRSSFDRDDHRGGFGSGSESGFDNFSLPRRADTGTYW